MSGKKDKPIDLSKVTPDEKMKYEIAEELGLSYKGAAAIYYRTIAKLRVLLGGEKK